MSNNIVVIGGGIAGITSALFYANKGANVTIVEKDNELGGLLKSQELFRNGFMFDYGTHFLKETGNLEIDKLLFGDLEVTKFDYLKTGTYYKKLYTKNGFVSTEYLPKHIEQEYLDKLKISNRKKEYNNLEEQLISYFGDGFGKVISKISEKFFYTKTKELAPHSASLFGLTRIIISSKEETEILKNKNEKFNDVLAYHSYKQGLSSNKSMYPKKGGAGEWIKTMTKKLNSLGVTIVTNAEIQTINRVENSIYSICINNKEYKLDKLIWTIPPYILLNKLNLKPQKTTIIPKRLTSCIFHLLVNEKYITDLYYLQCYNTDLKTFRVTLYDNYTKINNNNNGYRITVEVLLENPPENNSKLEKEIFDELKIMNIISKNTKLLESKTDIYPNGFPVLTTDFIKQSLEHVNIVESNISNVEIYGKSKGDKWFMNDIIIDIYNSINN